jgi:kanamycin kinase
VVDQGSDEDGTWLVTEALPGRSAVDARWKAEPERAVAAIGAGLRTFHEALPVDGCPFSWSVDERLADARERAAAGRVNPAGWDDPAHRALGLDGALRRLVGAPAVDRLVVCHGDSCSPNTLIDDGGRCSGHVDLGELGVADRWADLAIATWSTNWNYGPGWEPALLEAYGVDPDPDRTAYYRLLWELGP